MHVHRPFNFFLIYQFSVLHYLQAVLLLNLNNFDEYLIQHSLKSGGTKDLVPPLIERPVYMLYAH